MSESTPPENTDPATGPVLTPPAAAELPPRPLPPPPVAPQPVYAQESSRLNKAAAWIGIVAGSLFIAVVIFGTGFFVGKHVGNDSRGYHHGHHGPGMVFRPAGPMFPMGPPPAGFERGPGFPGPFPGGPVIDLRPPTEPGGPTGPGGANPGAPGGSGQQPR